MIDADGETLQLIVFLGPHRLFTGEAAGAEAAVRGALGADPNAAVRVFDARTGRVLDLDLRETAAVQDEITPAPRRGRPKLGVVAREVTLLPRHWDWLAQQPGGASVALRQLVEAARKTGGDAQEARMRRDAAYRFMSEMAGDAPGFEEASRALFAGNEDRLGECMADWPVDVRAQVLALLQTD